MDGRGHDKRVLIAEDDSAIRTALMMACEGLARYECVQDARTARERMSTESFDLLLLDWNLEPGGGEELVRTAERLQPSAWRIALFTIPVVDGLVEAMRAGFHDAWWVARGMELRDQVIGCWLAKNPDSKGVSPLALDRLADMMSARASAKRTSFFKARRDFSKTLIREVASRQGMSRESLARWMGVSVRTIQRLLAARTEPSSGRSEGASRGSK
jgi:CheY-like chemotaxis protein